MSIVLVAGTMLLLLCHFSRVRLCATPQTAAHQAPQSMGFARQEHWSGVPLPSPRDYAKGVQLSMINQHSFSSYLWVSPDL